MNRKLIEASNSGGLEAVLDIVGSGDPERLNIVHCCTALNRICRLATSPAQRAELQDNPDFRRLLGRLTKVLKGCEAKSASVAAHACASLGISDEDALAAVGAAVHANCESFDRQGVATVLWALAKLPRAARGDAPIEALTRAALDIADDFTPQELANVVWALPQVGAKDQQLVQKLALVARHRVQQFTPQGLGMVALGFSSLGVFSEPLFNAISKAAQDQAGTCNMQDAAQILTAFAKFKIKDDDLLSALCSGVSGADWSRQSGECVTSFLWALGTLRRAQLAKPLLPPLLERISQLAPTLRLRHVVLAMTGLAKVSAMAEELRISKPMRQASTVISERVSELVDRLDPQDLGLIAWAIALLGPPGKGPIIRAVSERASEVSDELSWWSVAHLEYAVRSQAGELGVPPERLLQPFLDCACTSEARLRKESLMFHAEPEAALVAAAPWESRSGDTREADAPKRALVVGSARAVLKSLQDSGFQVETWLRFSEGQRLGRAWPEEGVREDCKVCCLRYPGSSDALEFALHGAAAVLPRGARLWVFGHVQEGILGTRAALSPLFKLKRKPFGTGDARIWEAVRTKARAKQPFEAWLQDTSLDLGSGARPWLSVPGLFAGGGLDIMTQLLLSRLRLKMEGAPKILDFGCGNGALAAGLLASSEGAGSAGQLDFTLLDSDAAAMDVARRNVPGARCVVGDGLEPLLAEGVASDSQRFDVIVSNPPVHRGRPDDWRALRGLLEGAGRLLRPRGQLWLVAQEHVPVGRLLACVSADGSWGVGGEAGLYHVTLEFSDGRFSVWLAELAAHRRPTEISTACATAEGRGKKRRSSSASVRLSAAGVKPLKKKRMVPPGQDCKVKEEPKPQSEAC